jgi:hypothetical protein
VAPHGGCSTRWNGKAAERGGSAASSRERGREVRPKDPEGANRRSPGAVDAAASRRVSALPGPRSLAGRSGAASVRTKRKPGVKLREKGKKESQVFTSVADNPRLCVVSRSTAPLQRGCAGGSFCAPRWQARLHPVPLEGGAQPAGKCCKDSLRLRDVKLRVRDCARTSSSPRHHLRPPARERGRSVLRAADLHGPASRWSFAGLGKTLI